jgi:hypothetical protein
MVSGLVTVVDGAVADGKSGVDSSWFGSSDSGTKTWKIDVLSHLLARVAEEDTPEGSGRPSAVSNAVRGDRQLPQPS